MIIVPSPLINALFGKAPAATRNVVFIRLRKIIPRIRIFDPVLGLICTGFGRVIAGQYVVYLFVVARTGIEYLHYQTATVRIVVVVSEPTYFSGFIICESLRILTHPARDIGHRYVISVSLCKIGGVYEVIVVMRLLDIVRICELPVGRSAAAASSALLFFKIYRLILSPYLLTKEIEVLDILLLADYLIMLGLLFLDIAWGELVGLRSIAL